jgi:hypothetical protein
MSARIKLMPAAAPVRMASPSSSDRSLRSISPSL